MDEKIEWFLKGIIERLSDLYADSDLEEILTEQCKKPDDPNARAHYIGTHVAEMMIRPIKQTIYPMNDH